MSSVETGQISAVETGQMTAAETSVLSQQKTSVLARLQIFCVSETCSGPDTSKSPYLANRKETFQTVGSGSNGHGRLASYRKMKNHDFRLLGGG